MHLWLREMNKYKDSFHGVSLQGLRIENGREDDGRLIHLVRRRCKISFIGVSHWPLDNLCPALDAACTLLLYEHQRARGLSAGYQLRGIDQSTQTSLPLSDTERPAPGLVEMPKVAGVEASAAEELSVPVISLLGVVTELTGRYSPERLAVSAGSERVGLAGWIIDRVLGAETDVDEDTAKLGIAELIERGWSV
jgi:hypothetical protein